MRQPTRRIRLLVAALGLSIAAALGASGTAVAHHNESFGITACVDGNGDVVLTGTWTRMRVTAWSYFIEATDGSGGIGGPLAQPANSGTVSNTFTDVDPATISSLSITLYRGTNGDKQLATAKLNQRPAGWPPC